mgnify:CR=1 FL=1
MREFYGEAGAYIWGDSCKQLQNNAHTFVYSPFHAKANECTFAVGPLDLAAVIGESFADLGQTLAQHFGLAPLAHGRALERIATD